MTSGAAWYLDRETLGRDIDAEAIAEAAARGPVLWMRATSELSGAATTRLIPCSQETRTVSKRRSMNSTLIREHPCMG
jgi:hypothetical protein